jgi:nucleoside-diphosphate-sugar epimerase
MKRVLLTGASGFIGRHAIRPLLDGGYEVHAIARDVESLRAWAQAGVVLHPASLLDAAQTQAIVRAIQPTHLLHLAWYVAHGKFWAAPENLDWVAASLHLLRAFAEAGGQRVVMAGTCAEYDWVGDSSWDGVCVEQGTPLKPTTLYGASKHALQTMLCAFAAQTKLSAAWGRIFLLYGPHEPPQKLVPAVVRSLLQGEPARTSHGQQVRDLLHVQDVADAFVALLGSDVQSAVNIASGLPVALREVVLAIGDVLGRRELVQLGALPAAPNDPPKLLADVTRLRDEVGWQPKIDLRTGLAQTIDWWRSHL